MKTGTTTHPKFKRLQKKLGIPAYAVAGLLEMLWALASQYADDGDLSRFSAQEIADYCEWEGDVDQLVTALIESKWLDKGDDSLLIHDWFDHCPTYISERYRKRKPPQRNPDDSRAFQEFPGNSGQFQEFPGNSGQFQDIPGKSLPNHNPTQPNPTKPNQTTTKPNHNPTQQAVVAVEWSSSDENFVLSVRDLANRVLKASPKIEPVQLWKACWACLKLNSSAIDEMIPKLRTKSINKPDVYLKRTMAGVCEERGYSWAIIEQTLPQPPRIKPAEAIEMKAGA